MKKKLFNPLFDESQAAAFSTRFKSLDSLMGQGFKSGGDRVDRSDDLFHEDDLKRKYKTMQTPAILPSMKLRKQGKL